MILFRTPVRCFGRRGVAPAAFAGLGSAPSPLSRDALLGDSTSEWLWTLTTPLVSAGITQVNDDGGYGLFAPGNGTWVQGYRGFIMPQTGAVTVYASIITTVVGSTVYVAPPETGPFLKGISHSDGSPVPVREGPVFKFENEPEADPRSNAAAAEKVLAFMRASVSGFGIR